MALPCGIEVDQQSRSLGARPRPAARFTAVVVLPTPPFWLTTAMVLGNCGIPRRPYHPSCVGVSKLSAYGLGDCTVVFHVPQAVSRNSELAGVPPATLARLGPAAIGAGVPRFTLEDHVRPDRRRNDGSDRVARPGLQSTHLRIWGVALGGPDMTTAPPWDTNRLASGKRTSGSPAHRMTTAPNVPSVSGPRRSSRSFSS